MHLMERMITTEIKRSNAKYWMPLIHSNVPLLPVSHLPPWPPEDAS